MLNDNHFTIVTASEVSEICDPLFKQYGINYFVYGKIYDNGTAYALLSNGEYQKHHFQQQYLLVPPIPLHTIGKKFCYIVTENVDLPFQPVFYDLRNLFNIWYPIFMVERFIDHFELCIFASNPNNHQIINLYANHIDIFEKFKPYFKEKAKTLLLDSQRNIIHIPENMRPTFGGLDITPNQLDLDKQVFIQKINGNCFTLNYQNQILRISKQEVECIKHLKLGHTIKETAKHMKISPRTVETYLQNVKNKLKIKRKSQIVDIILEHGVFI